MPQFTTLIILIVTITLAIQPFIYGKRLIEKKAIFAGNLLILASIPWALFLLVACISLLGLGNSLLNGEYFNAEKHEGEMIIASNPLPHPIILQAFHNESKTTYLFQANSKTSFKMPVGTYNISIVKLLHENKKSAYGSISCRFPKNTGELIATENMPTFPFYEPYAEIINSSYNARKLNLSFKVSDSNNNHYTINPGSNSKNKKLGFCIIDQNNNKVLSGKFNYG